MRRALIIGVSCAAMVAAFASLLANAFVCIDSPAFYNVTALLVAAVGAGVVGAGAASIGMGAARRGSIVLLIGALVVAYAVVGPPYHTCAQFFVPM